MKFETLKDNNLKRYLIGAGVAVALLSPLVLNTSFAKYQTSQRIKFAEGKINYVPYDFKIMAMYQENDAGEYQEIETMPSTGYTINEEKSYCTLDNKVHDPNAKVYTLTSGHHVMENLSKRDKCYLWFDKELCNGTACKSILANKVISERTDFSQIVTTSSSGTIYKALDNDGTSYYFAGAVEDNYVKFADFYWRIIRINGDGTIRLIYDGTTPVDTQIRLSQFNSTNNDNMYVGYMHESNKVQGLINPSIIKGTIEDWYASNIGNNIQYASHVDVNAGFCGDRSSNISSSEKPNGTGGIGKAITHYGAFYRLYANKIPSFKCNSGNASLDLYTKTGASKGNKVLGQPVGLITADEVAFAGGINYKDASSTNIRYYLYTGQNYWTMTPCSFDGTYAYAFRVDSSGYFVSSNVINFYGIRPVINLRADISFSKGNGTINQPFLVE